MKQILEHLNFNLRVGQAPVSLSLGQPSLVGSNFYSTLKTHSRSLLQFVGLYNLINLGSPLSQSIAPATSSMTSFSSCYDALDQLNLSLSKHSSQSPIWPSLQALLLKLQGWFLSFMREAPAFKTTIKTRYRLFIEGLLSSKNKENTSCTVFLLDELSSIASILGTKDSEIGEVLGLAPFHIKKTSEGPESYLPKPKTLSSLFDQRRKLSAMGENSEHHTNRSGPSTDGSVPNYEKNILVHPPSVPNKSRVNQLFADTKNRLLSNKSSSRASLSAAQFETQTVGRLPSESQAPNSSSEQTQKESPTIRQKLMI